MNLDLSVSDWLGIIGFALALSIVFVGYFRSRRRLSLYVSRVDVLAETPPGVYLLVVISVINNSSVPKMIPRILHQPIPPLKINTKVPNTYDPHERSYKFTIPGRSGPLVLPEDVIGTTPTEIAAGTVRSFTHPIYVTSGEPGSALESAAILMKIADFKGKAIVTTEYHWPRDSRDSLG